MLMYYTKAIRRGGWLLFFTFKYEEDYFSITFITKHLCIWAG